MRIFMTVLIAAASLLLLWLYFAPQLGYMPKGELRERLKKSANYRKGRFKNYVRTPLRTENSPIMNTVREFLFGKQDRSPHDEIQTVPFDKNAFSSRGDGARFAWFGHSTVILNIAGAIILTDPVFSKRVSPLPFIGSRSFPYSSAPKIEELPDIDFVLLSHDHYDHLDYPSIVKIKNRVKYFLTPLGVSADLINWGVPREKIIELDWWESRSIGAITFTCAPARHFSGRKLIDSYQTLWCSWVLVAGSHRLFFGGDSGYGEHYRKIGERYGPFDLAMLECGQFNDYWRYVHELPEQVMIACSDLRGKKLLPLHWGKFCISLHGWKEPIEKLLSHANGRGNDIIAPQIGEIIDLASPVKMIRWWENYK
jgi:L-ascorbate metabolism protein UlaG (beta-lactamase superfamily)